MNPLKTRLWRVWGELVTVVIVLSVILALFSFIIHFRHQKTKACQEKYGEAATLYARLYSKDYCLVDGLLLEVPQD